MATVTPSRPPVFNLPNQLTAARLVLGIFLFALIDQHQWTASVLIFALAAFTDWLDGYLARKQGLTSTLGRNLDPLVDKVVICGAYIFLLQVDNSGLTPWMVTVVVCRELIITSLRSFMENMGATFGADWLGKLKMGLQCAALLGIFLYFAVAETNSPDLPWVRGLYICREILNYAMVITTALSGLQYLWRAFAILKKDMG